jgi:hypothetical protein
MIRASARHPHSMSCVASCQSHVLGVLVSHFLVHSKRYKICAYEVIQTVSFEWADAILKFERRSWGRPSQTHFKFLVFRHCGKKLCFDFGEAWCWRSVSPAVCDCADPSHQFLRPHHTTITTNHNMEEKIPPRKNTPASPKIPQPPVVKLRVRCQFYVLRHS